MNPYRPPASDLGQGNLITMKSLRPRAALLFSLPCTLLAIFIQGAMMMEPNPFYGIRFWEPTYTLLPISLAFAVVGYAVSKYCVRAKFWKLLGPSAIAAPLMSVVTSMAILFITSLGRLDPPAIRWDHFFRGTVGISIVLLPLIFLMCVAVRWYGRKHGLDAKD
jgi:hypothetical protein